MSLLLAPQTGDVLCNIQSLQAMRTASVSDWAAAHPSSSGLVLEKTLCTQPSGCRSQCLVMGCVMILPRCSPIVCVFCRVRRLLTTPLRLMLCPMRGTTTSVPTLGQRSTSTTPQQSLRCRLQYRYAHVTAAGLPWGNAVATLLIP